MFRDRVAEADEGKKEVQEQRSAGHVGTSEADPENPQHPATPRRKKGAGPPRQKTPHDT